jgi:hypothetical protein
MREPTGATGLKRADVDADPVGDVTAVSQRALTVSSGWEDRPAHRDRLGPSVVSTVAAIYIAGWIGSLATSMFVMSTIAVRSAGGGNIAGPTGGADVVWLQLVAAFVAGAALPHVLEALTGAVISYGGAVIATLAGAAVGVALYVLLPGGLSAAAAPGLLGLVLSLSTIPSLFVSYQVLRLVELQPRTQSSGRNGSLWELSSVVIPALAVLVFVALSVHVFRSTFRTHQTPGQQDTAYGAKIRDAQSRLANDFNNASLGARYGDRARLLNASQDLGQLETQLAKVKPPDRARQAHALYTRGLQEFDDSINGVIPQAGSTSAQKLIATSPGLLMVHRAAQELDQLGIQVSYPGL